MKVTVLIENTSNSELRCEHGLSLLIEFNGKKYLLDTGSSAAFLDNAKMLDISLDDVHACVLSHGHYDHSGGFYSYLNENNAVRVYAMESAIDSYYSSSCGMHEIGIPKPIIDTHLNRFEFINSTHLPDKGVYLIPHSSDDLASIGRKAGLFKKCGNEYLPDDFTHELSLVFDADKGLVIFNSCSHAGIINIINEVSTSLPGKNIYAFIGGLHMDGRAGEKRFCTFSEAEIKAIVNKLKEAGLEFLYTGHCTGNEGFSLLQKYLDDKIIRLTSGMRIEI